MALPYQSQNAGSSWSVAGSEDAFRFEVRSGDVYAPDPLSKERSEIKVEGLTLDYAQIYDIEYRFMIEAGARNTADWVILGQLHAREDAADVAAGPILAVELQGEKLAVVGRADPAAVGTGSPIGVNIYTAPSDVVRDHWYTVKLQVMVNPLGEGLVNVWLDGKQVANYSGALGYNDERGPYWKMGIYRSAAQETLAVNYQDLTIAQADAMDGWGGRNYYTQTSGERIVGTAYTDTLHFGGQVGVTASLALTGPQDTGGQGVRTIVGVENLIGTGKNDVLEGDAGDNILGGNGGLDTVSYASATAGVTVNLTLTGPQDTGGAGRDTIRGFENITGSRYADVLIGDANANVLAGGGGDDLMRGGAGSDVYDGGGGLDTVSFSDANVGIKASLAITASQGTGFGAKTFIDVENLIGSAFNDILTGDGGDNLLRGGDGADILNGGLGANQLFGEAGDDLLCVAAGLDRLDGGAGLDTVSFANANTGVDISLARTDAQDAAGGKVTLLNIENITGSRFDDILEGGNGDNVLSGGGGYDTVSYAHAASGVTVDFTITGPQNTIGAGVDTLSGFNALIGSAHNDVIRIGGGTRFAQAGAGDDLFYVDGGATTYDGGDGIDTVSFLYATKSVSASLIGPAAQSTGMGAKTFVSIENLIGGVFDDKLAGDSASNVLVGGLGADRLTGGEGADTFLYSDAAESTVTSRDLITDFQTGLDRIDLRGIRRSERDAYSIYVTGSTTYLDVDLEQDGSVDFRLTLTGKDVLKASDILWTPEVEAPGGKNDLDEPAAIELPPEAISESPVEGEVGAPPVVEAPDVPPAAEEATPNPSPENIYISPVDLTGTDLDEILLGDDRSNILLGGQGDDRLDGAEGDDILKGEDGDDLLIGGSGADHLDGGAGIDTASYAASASGVNVNLTLTTAQCGGDAAGDILSGIENLIGSAFADTLRGDASANSLNGGGGDDTIYGGGGLDNIIGGAGDDSLYAEGSAAAEMRGGDGDDVLTTLGTGGYKLYGGSGLDTFNLTTAVVGLTAEGADGDDVFNVAIGAGSAELSGGAGADTFVLTSGQVTMRGDAGQDVFRLHASQFSLAGSYNFRITGFETGPGGDKLDLVGAVNGLTSFGGGNPFTTGHMRLLQSGADTLVQVDANGGADSFSTLFTLTGVQATAITAFNLSSYAPGSTPPPSGETHTGTAAADTLTGTSGDDTLNGQGGDDILIGLGGADTLTGGAGIDTASYAASASGVNVNLTLSTAQSGGDAAGDILSGIENLIGSAFADTLRGDASANSLNGGAGDDTIYGGGGLDNIVGGAGNDSLYAEGSAAAEMRGGDGDDVLNTLGTGGYKLYGGSGLDTFNLTTAAVGLTAEGADGDDVFNVAIGAGSAELSGGAGADTFVLTSGQVQLNGGAGQDVFRLHASQFSLVGSYNFRITGFETGAGGDKLDLVGAVNGLTSFGGGNPFTTGHMRLLQSGADTLVQVDGDGGANSFATLFTLTGVQASAVTAFNLTGYAPDVATPPTPGITRTGTAGAETLTGTANADVLDGAGGDDTLIGGAGADTLTGGAGIDTASYAASASGVNVNLTLSTTQSGGDAAGDILSGIENLIGSAFADTLRGDASANSLNGGAGDDTIYGGGGLDNIVGGAGNDSLYAEGAAAAEMRGGDGDDVLNTLGTGGYKLYGGSGLDTFNLATAVVGLTAEGADGDDVFNVAIGAGSAELSGGAGADTFVLTSGQVTMRGDAGQDVFRLNASQFSLAGSYNFRITGFETGASGDRLDLVGAVNGLTNFAGGNPFATGHMRLLQSGADTLVQVDANGGADSFSTLFTLTGVQASAVTSFNLSSYAPGSTPPPSGETRTGTAGSDTLTGTAGDDTLNGLGGDDVLIGGAGADALNGGAGIDTADYGASSAGVTVNLTLSGVQSGGDAAGDILSGIENLGGSNFDDVLTGDGLANFLKGAQGDDQLNGGGGDDVLTGGKGADTLTGGTGADRFVFAAEHSGLGSGQRDVITDFSHAQGDLIDLSAFNGTFSFQGSAAFTGVANQIRYAASGGDTLVLGDVNGDGVADFEIQLIGSHSLVSNDFLL